MQPRPLLVRDLLPWGACPLFAGLLALDELGATCWSHCLCGAAEHGPRGQDFVLEAATRVDG